MLRRLALSLLLLAPALPGAAQENECPADASQRVFDLTGKARDGELTAAEAAQFAIEITRDCGQERALLGQILELFTVAGLALEAPDPERFGGHLNAFRTINVINRAGGGEFEPITLKGADGSEIVWSMIDERNAYWDLMFAMAGDFLVFGVHADIYTPGKIEQIGCGLYPAEEAAALASHAVGNVDGGELLARVSYLGRACDTPERDTSGYAALYFAEHQRARDADPLYVGLTQGDIHAGLRSFLGKHLDGAPASDIFTAGEAAELLNF
jgi:hypothetical protein